MDINVDMGNNTNSLIEKFGSKIEEYGGDLFQIALNQRDVYIAQYIFSLMLFVVLAISLIILIKRFPKGEEFDDSDIWHIIRIPIIIATGMVILIIGIILLNSSNTLIQWIINPEYATIQETIKLVRMLK